jgi:hypothetical protein
MSAYRAIPEDQDLVQGISSSIGSIVLNLALFEFDLNDIVDTTYHRLGGDRIDRKIPTTLPTSLLFVGKVARRHPGLLRFRADLLWIADEATRLVSLRHDVVHGYVAEYDETQRCLIRFARMKTNRDTMQLHEITLRRITRAELAKAGVDAAALAGRAAMLSRALQEEATADEPRAHLPGASSVKERTKGP